MVRLVALIGLLTLGLCMPAAAQSITLRWLDASGTPLETRTLTLEALDALPQLTITTNTPWTEGVHRFTGPALSSLATLTGRTAVRLRALALNDYAATLPAEDWERFAPVLATRFDGNTMRVKDKGPFWIMYPIDSHPALTQSPYYARMVWQVKSLDFVVK